MKYFLLVAIFIMSFDVSARNCRLLATTYDGFRCGGMSIKVKAADEEHCKELALSSVDNDLFGNLGRRDRILSIQMKFKEKKRTVKEKFVFEDATDLCVKLYGGQAVHFY